jgi:ABC-type transport system involved in Fe-S cluster assembly fused permease/ATPase subunit
MPWQLVLFDVIPTFIDIVVALVVFTLMLDWTLTVVIFFVMFAYGAYRGILAISIRQFNSV